MIQLTRLRHGDPFFLNPDLIERVDTHVDTVVRLTSGTEYLVNETAVEIVRRTADFRARVIALAGILQQTMTSPTAADATEPATAYHDVQPELVAAPEPGDQQAPDHDAGADSEGTQL
jgi:flagellar protein FlbD